MAGFNSIQGMSDGFADEMNNIPLGKIIGGPMMATVRAQGNAARSTVRFLTENCIDDYSNAPSWAPSPELDGSSLNPSLLPFQAGGMAVKKLPSSIVPKGHYPMGYAVRGIGENENRFFVAKKASEDIEPGTSKGWDDYWREVSSMNIRTVNFRYDQKVQTSEGTSKNSHSLSIPLMAMVPIPFLRIDQLDLDFNVKLSGVEQTSTTDNFSAAAHVGYKGGIGKKLKVDLKAGFSHQSTKGDSKKVSRSYDMNIKVRAGQSEVPVGIERMINLLDELITEEIEDIED